MMNFNLGDSEFNQKMIKLYGWIMPVIYGGLMILFLITQAWLTCLIFLIGLIITIPPLQEKMERFRIKGEIKVILCIMIFLLAIYSTGVYVV